MCARVLGSGTSHAVSALVAASVESEERQRHCAPCPTRRERGRTPNHMAVGAWLLVFSLALSSDTGSYGPCAVDGKSIKPAWQWAGQDLYECDIPKKFGLMWEEIGRQPPAQGRLLENRKLAEELQSTSAFVQDAWDIFNIKDLKLGDYIKSGDLFFKPVGDPKNDTETECMCYTYDAAKAGAEKCQSSRPEEPAAKTEAANMDTTVKRYKSCTHDPKVQYACIDPGNPLDRQCKCEYRCLDFKAETGWSDESQNSGPMCLDSVFSLEDTWSKLGFYFRHDQSPLPPQTPEETGDDYKCLSGNSTGTDHILEIKFEARYGAFNLYDMQGICDHKDLRQKVDKVTECNLNADDFTSLSSPSRQEDKLVFLKFWLHDQGNSGVTMVGTFQAIYVAMQALYYKGNKHQNTQRLRNRIYNPVASKDFPYEEITLNVSVNEDCEPRNFVQLSSLRQLMHIVDINDRPQIAHPKDTYSRPIQCYRPSTLDICHFGQYFSNEDSDVAVEIAGVEITDEDVKETCTVIKEECAKIDVSVRAARGSMALNTRDGLSLYENTREAQGFVSFLSQCNNAVKMLTYKVELRENIGTGMSSILNYNTQHSGNTESVTVTVSDQGLTGAAGVAAVNQITIDVSIIAVNDAPIIKVDTLEYTVSEDVLTPLKGIAVYDVDVNEKIESSLSRMTWMNPSSSQQTLNQLKFSIRVVKGILRLDYTNNLRLVDTASTSFFTIQRFRDFHDTCRLQDIYNDVEALKESSAKVSAGHASSVLTYSGGICAFANIGKSNCLTGTEAFCLCLGIFSCEVDGAMTLYINNTALPFLDPPNKFNKRLENPFYRQRWLDILSHAIESRDRTCGGLPTYAAPNNHTVGHLCNSDSDCTESKLQACTPGQTCRCCANVSLVCSDDSDCAVLDRGSLCGCVPGGPADGICGPYCKDPDLTQECTTKFLEKGPGNVPRQYGHQCTFASPKPNSNLPGATDPLIRECRAPAYGIHGSKLQKVVDTVTFRSLGSKRITFIADIVDVNRALQNILYITDANYNRFYRTPVEERDLVTFDIEADHTDTFTLTTDDLGNSGGKMLDAKTVVETVSIRVEAVNDRPVAVGPSKVYVREDTPFLFWSDGGTQIKVYDPDYEDYGFKLRIFTVNLTCSHGRLYLNESFLKSGTGSERVSQNRITYKMWDQEQRGLHYATLQGPEPKFGNLCQRQTQCSDSDAWKSDDFPYGFFESELHGLFYSPQTEGGTVEGCGICPEDTGNKFLSIEGVYDDINQALSEVTYLPDPHFNTRVAGRKEMITFQVNDNGALGNDAGAQALTHELKIEVLVESVNDRPIIGRKVKATRTKIKYDGGLSLPEDIEDDAILNMNKTLDAECMLHPPSGEQYWEVCGPGKRRYIDVDEDGEFFITPDVLWIEDVDSEESVAVGEPRRYCCDPAGLVGCRCGQACNCAGVACACLTPKVCDATRYAAGALRVHLSVSHGVLQFYPPPGRDFFANDQILFLTNGTEIGMTDGGPMIACQNQRDCMRGTKDINIQGRLQFIQTALEQMFLTYKPLPDYYGPDELKIWVSDDGYTDECYNATLIAEQTIKIRVVAVNDAPVIAKPSTVMVYARGLRCFNSFMDHGEFETGINRECVTNPNTSMFPPAISGSAIQFSDVDLDDKEYGNMTITIRIGSVAGVHENAGSLTLVDTLTGSKAWFVLFREPLQGLVSLRIQAKLPEINALMNNLRYDADPTFQGYVPVVIAADDNKNYGECSGDHYCGKDEVCADHWEAKEHTPVQSGFTTIRLDATVGAVSTCKVTDCRACSLTPGCGFCPGECSQVGGKCMVGTRAGPTYETCAPHPRDGRKWNECTKTTPNNIFLFVIIALVLVASMILTYVFLNWVGRRHGSLTVYIRKKQEDFKRAGRKAKILPPDEANYNMFFALAVLTASVVVGFVFIESERPDCKYNHFILLDKATSIELWSDACRVKFVPTRNLSYPDNKLDSLKMRIASPSDPKIVVTRDTCTATATVKVENKRDDSVKFINYYCSVQILVPDRYVCPKITIKSIGDNITSVRAGSMDPDSYNFGLRFGPNSFYLKGTNMVARIENFSATHFEYDVLHGIMTGIQVSAVTARLQSQDADIVMTTPVQTSVKFWQKEENLMCLTAASKSLYVDDSCKSICRYQDARRSQLLEVNRTAVGEQDISTVAPLTALRQSSNLSWVCTDNGDGTESCQQFDPVQAEIDDTCPIGAQYKKRSEVPRIVGCYDLKFCSLDLSSQCLCKPRCDMDDTLNPPGKCNAFGQCCQTICEGYSKADLFPDPDMPRCGRDVNPDFMWCKDQLEQQWNFTSTSGQMSLEVVHANSGNSSKYSSYRGSVAREEVAIKTDMLLQDKQVLNKVFHPGGRNSPTTGWFALRLQGPGTPEASHGEFVWLASVRALIWPNWILSTLSMGLLQQDRGAATAALKPSFCPAFAPSDSKMFQDRLIQMRKILLTVLQTFPGPDIKAIPSTSMLAYIPVVGAPRVFKVDPATKQIGVSEVKPGNYPLIVNVVYMLISISIILTTGSMLFIILSAYKIVKEDRITRLREEQFNANLDKVFTVLANVDESDVPIPSEKIREMEGRTCFFYIFDHFVLATAEVARSPLSQWLAVLYHVIIVLAPSLFIWILCNMLVERYQAEKCQFRPDVCDCFAEVDGVLLIAFYVNIVVYIFFLVSVAEMMVHYLALPFGFGRRFLRFIFYFLLYVIVWLSLVNLFIILLFILLGMLLTPIKLAPYAIAILGTIGGGVAVFVKKVR